MANAVDELIGLIHEDGNWLKLKNWSRMESHDNPPDQAPEKKKKG